MKQWWRAPEWWRMPLIGLIAGMPVSLTASLFLATYGADGPYGGFWRLLTAGLTASVPIFAAGGLLFAPIEIWLTRRPRRTAVRHAILMRGGVLGLAGAAGAVIANAIVVALLLAPPPPTLFPVLLVTYSFIGAAFGFSYTFYDAYVYQLRVSTELTQEMRLARDIQRGLFPRHAPHIPGFELAALCHPAREAGGDFYDWITLDDGRVGIVIADVAGKGMPAALLMANTRAIWRAEARHKYGPAETLRRVNRALYHDVNADSFVTLLYAVLDLAKRGLCIASAGHPLPLLFNDHAYREIEVYGLPLGLEPDSQYKEVSCPLSAGEAVLLYTDGIIEALNARRELFGFERLAALLPQEKAQSAQEIVKRVCSMVQAFSGTANQADDITTLVLKAHD